jgi:hypothetical protein
MGARLGDDDLARVATAVLGTASSLDDVVERLELDVDVDTVEDQLVDVSVERCDGCGWWCESSELVDDTDEVVGCESCR